MHELSIAHDVLELVAEHVPKERRPAVRVVRIRAGSLSGVVPEALEFCFQAAVADTPLSAARLEIEQVPTLLCCDSCLGRFELREPRFRCPGCGEPAVRLVGGTELDVTEVELDETVAEGP